MHHFSTVAAPIKSRHRKYCFVFKYFGTGHRYTGESYLHDANWEGTMNCRWLSASPAILTVGRVGWRWWVFGAQDSGKGKVIQSSASQIRRWPDPDRQAQNKISGLSNHNCCVTSSFNPAIPLCYGVQSIAVGCAMLPYVQLQATSVCLGICVHDVISKDQSSCLGFHVYDSASLWFFIFSASVPCRLPPTGLLEE